ncbi:oligoribonuclease [Candidatus Erwinia haradaeae]|uniref:Oligoribonuclease n=1 Tax=Candidatus Erwinia haradaeae TaxID=1922217 RepID=A0A451D2A5_9GAMM|nr:oligoribonuclease [Candidatus Erwinia haradaeae]VFP79744.1 Oligoribonuclease [Candidatus Erwinia haradaeae]
MSLNINHHLIWIDLEMTGLNPDRDRILEIAVLLTDSNLKILHKGLLFAISQTMLKLKTMDEWNKKTHTHSGLLERVKASRINEHDAEVEILKFLKLWVPARISPMCGNSISQDRRFLLKYMPDLEAYFHYRCIDVSTIKELVRRWKPEILLGLRKKNTHQALEDIYESVNELIYYRKHFITCINHK